MNTRAYDDCRRYLSADLQMTVLLLRCLLDVSSTYLRRFL